ncbi:N-acetyl-gamma-glutamyl-phosphate reductase [Chrysiogenes arsenatis]|uniref:N-acetyl-gamma-glutamyl-phosphate reductase n=1 Tax=Chrysiogenes arsenatis TaxID=309797 RepID=UPI00040A452E|nr:N-acetyl-gamma-glutamyl-phosphate reductase [Chrysiogenes arsenatis]
MIKAAIIGATGYTGAELVKLLLAHPDVTLVALTSESSDGERLIDHYPALTGRCSLRFQKNDPDAIAPQCDVVFLALPHGEAMANGVAYRERGVKVVDLSADFRLDCPEIYRKHYHLEHVGAAYLSQKVYGLPEINREKIKATSLVANPGCYPTCSLLGLAPALQNNFILPRVIIDAKSGVSGAGKKPSTKTHFVEVNEGFSAYGVGTHRHHPEIVQEMGKLIGTAPSVVFTPHLLPMSRGMLCTSYADLAGGVSAAQIVDAYQTFCAHEPFVHFLGRDCFPNAKDVRGSNNCFIGVHIDENTQRLIVISVIDNLVKGASGAAVQNMNLMFGIEETTALLHCGQVL